MCLCVSVGSRWASRFVAPAADVVELLFACFSFTCSVFFLFGFFGWMMALHVTQMLWIVGFSVDEKFDWSYYLSILLLVKIVNMLDLMVQACRLYSPRPRKSCE